MCWGVHLLWWLFPKIAMSCNSPLWLCVRGEMVVSRRFAGWDFWPEWSFPVLLSAAGKNWICLKNSSRSHSWLAGYKRLQEQMTVVSEYLCLHVTESCSCLLVKEVSVVHFEHALKVFQWTIHEWFIQLNAISVIRKLLKMLILSHQISAILKTGGYIGIQLTPLSSSSKITFMLMFGSLTWYFSRI